MASQFHWALVGLGDSDEDVPPAAPAAAAAATPTPAAAAAIPTPAAAAAASPAPAAAAAVPTLASSSQAAAAAATPTPAAAAAAATPAPAAAAAAANPPPASSSQHVVRLGRPSLLDRPLARLVRTRPVTEPLLAEDLSPWWRSQISNGLMADVGRCPDVQFRFPRVEPGTERAWLDHCLSVWRGCSGHGSFYWGITESPMARWEQHSSTYDMMRICAVAQSSRQTASLEVGLIAATRRSVHCNNYGPGAECRSGGSPHFLYLCSGTIGGLTRRGPSSSKGTGRGRQQSMTDFVAELNGRCPLEFGRPW